MKNVYNFTPELLNKTERLNKTEKEYIRIILRSLVLYLVIGLITFFAFLGIFSNINSFWGIFKKAESYQEESAFKPSKPYLKVENEYTSQEEVDLEGIADSGNTVVLYKNGEEESDVIADKDNKYVFNGVSIDTEEGAETKFYTIATNEEGIESSKSNELTIVYDSEDPDLTVIEPQADDRINSYSRTLEVKGSSEPNANVTVNGNIARTSTDGTFSATIALENEVNVINVKAVDRAGNETLTEIPVYFEKKED